MSKPSKRHLQAAERRRQIEEASRASSETSAGEAPSPAPEVTEVEAPQAVSQVDESPVTPEEAKTDLPVSSDAKPSSGAPDAATMSSLRVKGAGVSRVLSSLGAGLAGQLKQAEENLLETTEERDLLRRQNEELLLRFELEQQGTAGILSLDPATVMLTKFDNRDAKSFTDEDRDFRALREDIQAKHGNVMPGMVRPLDPPEDGYFYEAVYGNRRLAACRQAGVKFRALVQSVSDEEAMLLQHVENAHRKNLSSIEMGLKIKSFLDHSRNETGRAGWNSVATLSSVIKLEKGHISKLGLIGSIPAEVLAAIPDVRQVPYRSAYLLAKACRDRPNDILAAVETLPAGISSKKAVLHLVMVEADGASDGKDESAGKQPSPARKSAPTPSSDRWVIRLPSDELQRSALKDDLLALEKKYGLKLMVDEGGGGDAESST